MTYDIWCYYPLQRSIQLSQDKLNRYLFSLGAVVAREYGLPCIVGVKNATKLFKTGDIVFLSGKTGELGKI